MTDRTKIKQILLNLLSNAVKFTAEGSVVLRARSLDGGERFRVEVEDTGIGIDQADMETIFDDFRQVDQSSTRQYGGTGLGLSITRKLVTLLGGHIGVDSRYGEGSTFSIELPATLTPEEGDFQTVGEKRDEAAAGAQLPSAPSRPVQ
jgi:signal transduction histidine kinase